MAKNSKRRLEAWLVLAERIEQGERLKRAPPLYRFKGRPTPDGVTLRFQN
jgi:hypothetical protein